MDKELARALGVDYACIREEQKLAWQEPAIQEVIGQESCWSVKLKRKHLIIR